MEEEANRRVHSLVNKPNGKGAPISDMVSPRPVMRFQKSDLKTHATTQSANKSSRNRKDGRKETLKVTTKMTAV